jgi:hypothetical protein
MLEPFQKVEVWREVILSCVNHTYWFSFSKEYLESQDSFENNVFCVDGDIRKNIDTGLLEEEDIYGGGVVLYVQKSGESIDHLLLHCEEQEI